MEETKTVYGSNAAEEQQPPHRVRADQEENSRDPSDLPVNNWEAYRTWCQKVKEHWDD